MAKPRKGFEVGAALCRCIAALGLVFQVSEGLAAVELPVVLEEEPNNFGIRDGSRPVSFRNVIVPPGETVVGVFGTGQEQARLKLPGVDLNLGAGEATAESTEDAGSSAVYRFEITRGDKVSYSTAKPSITKDHALDLKPGSFRGSIVAGTSWYRLKIPGTGEPGRYSFDGGIDLSRIAKVELQTDDGEVVSSAHTDKAGQFHLPNLVLEP